MRPNTEFQATNSGISANDLQPKVLPHDEPAPADSQFPSLEVYRDSPLKEGRFSVHADTGLFECRLDLRPEYSRLFIVLTSSHAPNSPLPTFKALKPHQQLPGSVLYVSDPTLFLDRTLSLGWYLGTVRHDWGQALVRLVQQVAANSNLMPEDIYVLGTAGAGLAAIQLACGLGPATAIAINPHTDVRQYHTAFVNSFFSKCFGSGSDVLKHTDDLERRLSAIVALQGAAETKLVYVQNRADAHTFHRHFLPFCSAFGLDSSAGSFRDDNMEVMLYDEGGSRTSAEPQDLFADIIEHAIAFNDSGLEEVTLAEQAITHSEPEKVKQVYIQKESLPAQLIEKPWKIFSGLAEYKEQPKLKKGRFTVDLPDGHKFDCLFIRKRSTQKLFIMLSGARNWKIRGPEFTRYSWHPTLPGSMLCITDPTIAWAGRKLALAWYVGTAANNWTTAMAELVRATCEKLGIKTSDVIIYGSSGGGFGAMTLAAALGDATAVAINPQSHVLRYNLRAVNNFLKIAFGVSSADALAPELIKERLSAIDAIDRTPNAKVLYVQSRNDKRHYEHHYVPFCSQFGLPLKGGSARDGTLQTWLYHDRPGHRGEPEKLVPEILTRAMALSSLGTRE
ncbi:hypothetical protein [Bordetella sp. BOR01]|uniref:hypothetical protein n=1 Tax=Bordetella sp. BOR01 TaxID=2854779 RepID=UPI001C489477|nr:hypothetical protein [Bordetella sp. BOR01]MBV7486189.1 hypothetical protein [Bordetella sp. BOR01]